MINLFFKKPLDEAFSACFNCHMKFAIFYLPLIAKYWVAVQFATSPRWRQVGPQFGSWPAASSYLRSLKK